MYGCNVCGEGGEYETLTLDCPLFRWARIVLDSWQLVLHSMDSVAPVGVLHATAFHLESKNGEALADMDAVIIDVPEGASGAGPTHALLKNVLSAATFLREMTPCHSQQEINFVFDDAYPQLFWCGADFTASVAVHRQGTIAGSNIAAIGWVVRLCTQSGQQMTSISANCTSIEIGADSFMCSSGAEATASAVHTALEAIRAGTNLHSHDDCLHACKKL